MVWVLFRYCGSIVRVLLEYLLIYSRRIRHTNARRGLLTRTRTKAERALCGTERGPRKRNEGRNNSEESDTGHKVEPVIVCVLH